MRPFLLLVIAVCSLPCAAQEEVTVSHIKGGIVMSIPAQKAYQLMPGEEKTPTLAVECLLHKDKKGSHLVLFMPGGTLATEAPGDTSLRLVLTFDGTRHVTPW